MSDQKPPTRQLPVIDEKRIDTIFEELGGMEVELDPDPLEFGPKRIARKVAQARGMLTRCERIFLQVAHDLQMYHRTHRSAELDFELQVQDLLANDSDVRAGRNVRDRDALATMKLRDERKHIIGMDIAIGDLEAVMKVVKAKRADLRDVQGRLRDQKALCDQEVALGAKWRTKLPPGITGPDLDNAPRTDKNALQQVQDLLVEEGGEIHLEAGDENWMVEPKPEGEELNALLGSDAEEVEEAEPDSMGSSEPDPDPEPAAKVEVEPKPEVDDLDDHDLDDPDELSIDAILAEVEAAKNDTTPVEGDGEAKVEEAKVEEAKVEATPCPKCGVGLDTDGGGDCVICARLSTEEAARLKAAEPEPEPEAKIDVDDLFNASVEEESSGAAMPSVTTDEDVDDMFRRLTVDPPPKFKSKHKLPPPSEADDMDSLIDLFT